MKIEKITENKIRVIINSEDLDENNTDIHALMTKSLETQDLFLEMYTELENVIADRDIKALIKCRDDRDEIQTLIFKNTK